MRATVLDMCVFLGIGSERYIGDDLEARRAEVVSVAAKTLEPLGISYCLRDITVSVTKDDDSAIRFFYFGPVMELSEGDLVYFKMKGWEYLEVNL